MPFTEDVNYVNVDNVGNNSTMMLCRDLPSALGGHTSSMQDSSLNFKDSYCYISLGTDPGPECLMTPSIVPHSHVQSCHATSAVN